MPGGRQGWGDARERGGGLSQPRRVKPAEGELRQQLFPERRQPLGFGDGASRALLGGSCLAKASGWLTGPLAAAHCLRPRGGSRLSPRTRARFGTAVPKLSRSARL